MLQPPATDLPANGKWTLTDTDRAQALQAQAMPVTVVLDRLRSAFNVGNIFRLSEATRVEQIIACGYTARPPHAKLAKSARGTDTLVACSYAADSVAAITALAQRHYRIYAVETVAEAESVWDVQLSFPAAFVFGNEALGIAAEALVLCDACIRLPVYGVKNSINVGNSAAVVLYEALRQWHDQSDRRRN